MKIGALPNAESWDLRLGMEMVWEWSWLTSIIRFKAALSLIF